MKITSPADIGKILRQKRKTDGLTLEEAAAVCGVSYAFLAALENGQGDGAPEQGTAGCRVPRDRA